MDIKLPINLQNLSALTLLIDNPLALKVGQKIDVKVISALIKAEINTIVLKLANNTITVQSNQPIKLLPGQDLQVQVTKIAPVLEFAIIDSPSELKRQIIPADSRLKLVAAATNKQGTESTKESPLPLKQPLAAKIIGISGSKIQLQVFTVTESSLKQQNPAEPGLDKPFIIITVDRSQLQTPKTANPSPSASTSTPANQVPEFKVGQAAILEIHSMGTTPQFKISLAPPSTTDEKVTEFIKQFLPKHESSPVLLNQLINDLPQLLSKNNVPEALQRLAAEILQNLPQRQQLNESPILKQSFINSGLFLEAKIPKFMENPDINLEQDFKANLLNLVDVLKKEVGNPEKPELKDLDVATLKNLQQKTENNVAKIILDQLISLPKDDNPKQIWTIDIPFVDRGQADAVNIQIAQDKENDAQPGNSKWSVTITMNPPGLGIIQCNLSFFNETIYTHFRSHQPKTTELITHHLDHLKQQMESAGLKSGLINIQNGLEPTKPAYQIAKNTLFDEKA